MREHISPKIWLGKAWEYADKVWKNKSAVNSTYFSFKIKQWLKGTLMQIWKFPYMFVLMWKQYPENFALLTSRIVELFTGGVCKILKM